MTSATRSPFGQGSRRYPRGLAAASRLLLLWAPVAGFCALWTIPSDPDLGLVAETAMPSLVFVSLIALACAAEVARLRRRHASDGALVACVGAAIAAAGVAYGVIYFVTLAAGVGPEV